MGALWWGVSCKGEWLDVGALLVWSCQNGLIDVGGLNMGNFKVSDCFALCYLW